jgi:hypothetical protein
MASTLSGKSPVNIVCLKWGNKYPAEYVNRLYRMVSQNISIPYRFICLTEDSEGIIESVETKPIALDPDLHGWWYKLQLFQRELHDLTGSTLFLDLDVVIFEVNKFCIIQDLQASNLFNSSVFRLDVGSYPEVWEDFQKDKQAIVKRLYGDQDWVSEKISNPVLWPKDWVVSFKKQCNSRSKNSFGHIGKFLRSIGLLKPKGVASIPEGAKIIYFHGKPDPDDVADSSYDMWKHAPWIKDAWAIKQQ